MPKSISDEVKVLVDSAEHESEFSGENIANRIAHATNILLAQVLIELRKLNNLESDKSRT